MKRKLKIIALSLSILFLIAGTFIVLTATNPSGQIEGKVVLKMPNEITVEKFDGSQITIPVSDFDVGDDVNIMVYTNDFTGKTEYRYFKAYVVEPPKDE